jgi:predicted aspartyl protease
MSVAYGAILSDPLSQLFPYNIVTIPLVFSPSESSAVATGIIDGGLVAAAIIFEAVVNEINSYGASTRQLDEATVEEIQTKVKSEIDRIVKDQTVSSVIAR